MINTSEIVAAYGAYYEQANQNKKRILRLLTQGSITPKSMTMIKTKDTIYKLAEITLGKIIQPFRKGFHPIGDLKFTPNEIRLFHIKIDSTIHPDDIEDTWLGFLAGQDLARKDWPLVKYIIETVYIPQIHADMENYAYFHGVYKAPVDGQPTNPEDCMDGLGIQLQRGVDSTTHPMNLVDVAELNPTSIFDQLEAFDDAISKSHKGVYENVKMNIFVSPAMLKAYKRDKRSQGFYDMKSDKDVDAAVDFSPRTVTALPSMIGYNYAFATPIGNLLHLTKRGEGKAKIKLEESKREVDMLTDWYEGVGFGCNAAVWSNKPKTA